MLRQTGDHDGRLAERDRRDDAADPRVADDGRGACDEGAHVLALGERDPFEAFELRPRRGVPVLHEHALLPRQWDDHVDRPPERLFMGPQGEQDQKMPPRYSALEKCRRMSGHCTKKRWATGCTSRPVSDGAL